MTLSRNDYRWFYGLLFLFIGLNCVFFALDFYWFALLPVVLFGGWLFIYHPDKVLYLIVFTTPLSTVIDFKDFGLSLDIPTEPLLMVMMVLFWLRVFLDGKYDWRVFRHPITVAILLNLAWILFTSFTSTMPVVSFKFFTARLWFITSAYFMGAVVFRKFGNIKTFIWLFATSMCIMIIYTMSRHATHGWDQGYASIAPIPFFSDHTVYAATITFTIPAMLLFVFRAKILRLSTWQQFFAIVLSAILLAGLVFSFTRAAWMGMAAAIAAAVIFIFRIKLTTIMAAIVLIAAASSFYWVDIYFKLKANKKVSASNFEQHVESMYNISTDVSNTERINRWKSAWRMFNEKPLTGWGPGTYMFQYAPFQLSREMTIISTRTGKLGNAHSEYIGPLAEEGIFGTLTIVGIVLVSLFKSQQLIYRSGNRRVKWMAMAVICGLIAYYVHGIVNNYLDTDKASIPFWGFLAMLTAMDLYHKEPDELKEKISSGEDSQVI